MTLVAVPHFHPEQLHFRDIIHIRNICNDDDYTLIDSDICKDNTTNDNHNNSTISTVIKGTIFPINTLDKFFHQELEVVKWKMKESGKTIN